MSPTTTLVLALQLVLLVLASSISGAAPKLVRVDLGKKINSQGGSLQQPLTSYYMNVAIGTPPKEFKLLVDVNARETWVPHYHKMGICLFRLNYMNGYCKKDSKTSLKEEREVYNIGYRGSEFGGKAYKDFFELQNVTESVSPVKFMQRFLAISDANNDAFTNYGVDGVLALNPWPISETGSERLTVGLGRAHLTGELKFGLDLNYDDDRSDKGGEITFGGVNPTKFMGALRFHEVPTQHTWELNLKGVMLGAETVACGIASDKCTALISTTSNDIYGPAKYIRQIIKSLGHLNIDTNFREDKLHEIDCLKVASAPSLTFIIDDAYYVLRPTSYIRKKVAGVIFKSETCYVSLLSNGSTDKWELGTNFLSNYYTVFDLDFRKVAFGAKTRH